MWFETFYGRLVLVDDLNSLDTIDLMQIANFALYEFYDLHGFGNSLIACANCDAVVLVRVLQNSERVG